MKSKRSTLRFKRRSLCGATANQSAEVLEKRALLTIFVVDATTDDTDDLTGVADGQLSLREAITASNTNAVFGDAAAGSPDGDVIVFANSLSGMTILVSKGQFTIGDDVNINGSGLNVPLTLDAGGLSRLFSIETSASAGAVSAVTLEGFTLSNGNTSGSVGDDGGAISISNDEQVTLTTVTIRDNSADGRGGAIYNGNGTLTIRNGTVIEGNTAAGAAANHGGGGVFNNGGTLVIDGSAGLVWISDNLATGTSGSGGGIFSTSGSVKISETTITFNSANRAGGGIEIVAGTMLLDNVNLIGNDVDGTAGTANPGNGGGLHVSGAANVTIDSGSVFENTAAREGGGLWNQVGATLTIRNGTLIQFNDARGAAADDGGGGIFNNGGILNIDGKLAAVEIAGNGATGLLGSGGGIFNFTGGVVTINDATIRDNEAERAGGGIEDAANVSGVTGLTLTRVTLASNFALGTDATAPGNGGGLHVTGAGRTLIVNSTVSGNFADVEGGGLWNSSTGTLIVRNSTITGNSAGGASSGGGIKTTGGPTTLTNTIIAGNVSGPTNQANDISGAIFAGSAANLVGNAASSGGLTNGVNGNLVGIAGVGTLPIAQILNPVLANNGGMVTTHILVAGSLAINAGIDLTSLGVTTDQRGVSRPKGGSFDIGAVEVEVAITTGIIGRKWLDLNADGVRLPKALVDLGFFAQNGQFYFNIYGGQEKWVRAANLDWYFIKPDGVLTKWNKNPFLLTGTVVAQLPTRFYIDEYLLVETTNEPFLNGWTIELLDASGNVVSTAVTADIDLNKNNSIDPESERGVYQFTVLVSGTYSVREVQQNGYSQSAGPSSVDAQAAYDLDQSLNLVYTGDYFTNFGGRGENWLRKTSGWIYILPDGSVYSWDGVSGGTRGLVNGTFIKKLDPSFHTNPQLLSNAVNPKVAFVSGSVATGPQFGNYRLTTISGRVFEDTDQNGVRDASELYRNNRSVQLIDRDGNVVSQVFTLDVDSDGTPGINPNTESGIYQFMNVVPGSYTVRQITENGEIQTAPYSSQFAPLAYRVDQELDLNFTGNYFETFGTNQERFLYSRALNGWVYITKSGDLFRWNPTSGPAPNPLTGTLIARFDATYYYDPTRLYNAPATSIRLSSGEVQANYDFGYFDIDAAFGDSGLFA